MDDACSQESTVLVALGWQQEDNTLMATAMRLNHDTQLECSSPIQLPIPRATTQPSMPQLATSAFGDRFYIARRDRISQEFILERHHFFSDTKTISWNLGTLELTAILGMENTCLVASIGRLDRYDFNHTPVTRDWSFLPPEPDQKLGHVDTFTRSHKHLVAIDNALLHKTAYVFELSSQPQLCFWSSLPDYTNETCHQAALTNNKLAIRTSFFHRGGSGQRLLLFDIEQDSLITSAQAMEIRGVGMFRFGHRRLAGRMHSNWQGLGILGDNVILGAQERGIILCDCAMEDEDQAQRQKLGGVCEDLVVCNQKIYALVSSGGKGRKQKTRLVVLEQQPDQTELTTLNEFELDFNPTQFSG